MTWGELKKMCKGVPDEAIMKYGYYIENADSYAHFFAYSVEITKHYCSDDGELNWTVELQ